MRRSLLCNWLYRFAQFNSPFLILPGRIIAERFVKNLLSNLDVVAVFGGVDLAPAINSSSIRPVFNTLPSIKTGLEITSHSILATKCSLSVEQLVSQSSDGSPSLLEIYITESSDESELSSSRSNDFLDRFNFCIMKFFAILSRFKQLNLVKIEGEMNLLTFRFQVELGFFLQFRFGGRTFRKLP